jgi:hypothetical protein
MDDSAEHASAQVVGTQQVFGASGTPDYLGYLVSQLDIIIYSSGFRQ